MTQAFGFRHLPSAGGLYDQNPELLDKFMYILGEQNAERERKEAEREKNRGGPKPNIKNSSRAAY